jgi:hypothetical protein
MYGSGQGNQHLPNTHKLSSDDDINQDKKVGWYSGAKTQGGNTDQKDNYSVECF